jgi:hypothetical protein
MDVPINFRSVVANHLAAHADAQLYFLLDHAGLSGLVRELDQCAIRWISLFDDTRESAALKAAPIFVHIGRQEAPLTGRFLDWLAKHGVCASAVTLLDSPLPTADLRRRLVARLDVTLSENMVMMLRFFDPRILSQLRITLTAAQSAAFFSVASHWWYLDRAGMLIGFSAAFLPADAACIPLVLHQKQEFALVDASEADHVLALLTQEVPNLMASIPPCERYGAILTSVSGAKKEGDTSIHDLMVHVASELFKLTTIQLE